MGPQPPQAPQQPQEQGSPAGEVISNIHENLLKLMDIFEQAKLPPEDVQHLGGIITSFQALVEELSGNGKPQQKKPMGPMADNQAEDSIPV